MVKIELTRDSVAAGDDCDAPHERTVVIEPAENNNELVEQLIRGYLPSVNGVGHSWTVILNGDPIATVRVTGIEALTSNVRLVEVNSVHFHYHSATY